MACVIAWHLTCLASSSLFHLPYAFLVPLEALPRQIRTPRPWAQDLLLRPSLSNPPSRQWEGRLGSRCLPLLIRHTCPASPRVALLTCSLHYGIACKFFLKVMQIILQNHWLSVIYSFSEGETVFTLSIAVREAYRGTKGTLQ